MESPLLLASWTMTAFAPFSCVDRSNQVGPRWHLQERHRLGNRDLNDRRCLRQLETGSGFGIGYPLGYRLARIFSWRVSKHADGEQDVAAVVEDADLAPKLKSPMLTSIVEDDVNRIHRLGRCRCWV
jgi:hypothetical protein